MYPVRISVTITGTDDNGDTRNWSATGQIDCVGATDQNLTLTTTPTKIVERNNGDDQAPSYIYIENYGDNDAAYGVIDPNGINISHAIPAGASLFIKVHQTIPVIAYNVQDVQLWAATGTTEVRYILFY